MSACLVFKSIKLVIHNNQKIVKFFAGFRYIDHVLTGLLEFACLTEKARWSWL